MSSVSLFAYALWHLLLATKLVYCVLGCLVFWNNSLRCLLPRVLSRLFSAQVSWITGKWGKWSTRTAIVFQGSGSTNFWKLILVDSNLIWPHIYCESKVSQNFCQGTPVFYFPSSSVYIGHLKVRRDYCHLFFHAACSSQPVFFRMHIVPQECRPVR